MPVLSADEAGNRILLDRQRRHVPGVDHVGRSDQDTNFLADRHHDVGIGFQQIVGIGVAAGDVTAVDLRAGSGQGAVETDAFTLALEVVVTPLPLVTGGLDGHVRLRGVAHRDQRAGGGNRQRDQDHERDQRPGHLDGGVFMELRGLVPDRLAVLEHGVEHETEHADEDDEADDRDDGVKVVDFFAEQRMRRLQIEFVLGPGRSRPEKQRQRCAKTLDPLDAHSSPAPKARLIRQVRLLPSRLRSSRARCWRPSSPQYRPISTVLPWERSAGIPDFPVTTRAQPR
jgi:hypothetical protein